MSESGAVATALVAARTQWRPLVALQLLVAAVVVGYFCSPAVDAALRAASAQLGTWGLPGVFVAAGLASGLLAEGAVVLVHQRGRWRAGNTGEVAFRFLLYGVNAVLVSLFYQLQARVFGDSAAWAVLLPKLVVDQVLFAPLVCLPLQVGASRLRALHFRVPLLREELRDGFLRERYLPALVTQWLFWPPVTVAIYLFPVTMQTLLFLLIGATWALLLVALTRRPTAARRP